MLKTYQIIIKGQVQGVGFRPFVYNLAHAFKINGSVSNNEEGVVIILSGNENNIYTFYQKLIKSPPPVSKITHHQIDQIEFTLFKDFSIIPSTKGDKLNLTLTPDFAICKDCESEIKDPKNRRFQYPFTTCVNCGPRWSLTNTFPFERANTAINSFPMCKTCLEEYTDPTNHRFHSQTNTCAACGIQLRLTDNNQQNLDLGKYSLFEKISKLLSEGKIIAIKNTSGYLLCCDARNEKTIQKLRERKKRPHKPFAVLYPSLELLQKEVLISTEEIKALTSTERPIVIVSTSKYKGGINLEGVAPQLKQLGVMLPYTGILQLLANKLTFPIVATSGNIHGSPIISDEKLAVELLSTVADYFLHHNLEISNPQDDSVLKISSKFETKVLFRRSRGYAPNYFDFKQHNSQKILATGSHLKSSIAFVPNEQVYISQYLGNLDHFDVVERYTNTISYFMELFEEQPEIILTDSHPQYQSNVLAKELGVQFNKPVIEIQHHKAHFASVLGENNLFNSNDKILGVIWDGTGFGDDKNIWGSEFFTFEKGAMNRLIHLSYFNWFAGDKMAKEPRLSLLSLSNDEIKESIKNKFSEEEWAIYQSVIKNNTLKTSSMGRLFDALASLLNLVDYNTYEGEAAIVLENQVKDYQLKNCKNYHPIVENGLILPQLIIQKCYEDFMSGVSIPQIISNFLFTLSSIILEVANQQNIKHIALSGGVFQNTTLIDMLTELAKDDFYLYFNNQLPPNDENISFGQLMYYYHCENLGNRKKGKVIRK
ncbi:MAG: carbamoyltransferase HypF [Flavobacteriaceae bacterium]|nr:carbamoyltransferase HypF [Flavobacteriaceae bacterium]